MACTTCSRSAPAAPSTDRLIALPAGSPISASAKVLAGTFAEEVTARFIATDDQPDLRSILPTAVVLTKAVEVRIITKNAAQKRIEVVFSNVDYQGKDGTKVQVFAGKSIVDPVGWHPIPDGSVAHTVNQRLYDSNGKVNGGKIAFQDMVNEGNFVVLVAL